MREETRQKIVTIMNRCAIVICAVSLVIAIYLASQNAGLIDGTFGPQELQHFSLYANG